jgi:hypothetical protein
VTSSPFDECVSTANLAARAIISDLTDELGNPTISYGVVRIADSVEISFEVDGVRVTVEIDCGFSVDWRLLALQFADHLQDVVVEKTREARPLCPEHGDLLIPDRDDGDVPMWRCRRGRWRVAFGDIARGGVGRLA